MKGNYRHSYILMIAALGLAGCDTLAKNEYFYKTEGLDKQAALTVWADREIQVLEIDGEKLKYGGSYGYANERPGTPCYAVRMPPGRHVMKIRYYFDAVRFFESTVSTSDKLARTIAGDAGDHIRLRAILKNNQVSFETSEGSEGSCAR